MLALPKSTKDDFISGHTSMLFCAFFSHDWSLDKSHIKANLIFPLYPPPSSLSSILICNFCSSCFAGMYYQTDNSIWTKTTEKLKSRIYALQRSKNMHEKMKIRVSLLTLRWCISWQKRLIFMLTYSGIRFLSQHSNYSGPN